MLHFWYKYVTQNELRSTTKFRKWNIGIKLHSRKVYKIYMPATNYTCNKNVIHIFWLCSLQTELQRFHTDSNADEKLLHELISVKEREKYRLQMCIHYRLTKKRIIQQHIKFVRCMMEAIHTQVYTKCSI